MQVKVENIIKAKIPVLEKEIAELIAQKQLSEERLTSVLTNYFTELLESSENNEMQNLMYRRLGLIFHPDKFKNEVFKYASHLREQGFERLPHQILSTVHQDLLKNSPPKFSENLLDWANFVGNLLFVIAFSESESKEFKTARKELEKNAFVLSKLYGMWEGLGKYFLPIEYVTKIIMGVLLVASLVAIMIVFGIRQLISGVLYFPRSFMTALIKLVAGDEYERQFLKMKEDVLQEIFKFYSAIIEEQPDPNAAWQAIRQEQNAAIEDTLNDNGQIRLKLIVLAFFHALFKDISQESTGSKALFIFSWPFKFIAMMVVFALAAPIELTRIAVDAVLLLFLLACTTANMSLLFVLNLPLYVFFEIPRTFINWIKSDGDSFKKESENITHDDKSPDEVLKLEYTETQQNPYGKTSSLKTSDNGREVDKKGKTKPVFSGLSREVKVEDAPDTDSDEENKKQKLDA